MIMRTALALGVGLLLTGSMCAQSPYTSQPSPLPNVAGETMPAPSAAPAPVQPMLPALPTVPASDGRVWASADFLAWWLNGRQTPALVTTSPAGTARTAAGVGGQPNTSILFGGGTLNDDIRSGLRLAFGYWFGAEGKVGVEAGFSMLESQSSFYSASSTAIPILARPYTDGTNFTQQAVLVAFPGLTNGSIGAQVGSGNFYQGNIDFAVKLVDGPGPVRVDGLVGYRFYRFDEGLRVQQTMTPTDPRFIAGTLIQAADDFGVTNEFHGLDLGLRPRFVWQSLSVDLLAKLAVGNLHQVANVLGAQVITVPGAAPLPQPGGVLALPTNIGTYTTNRLAVVPEFGAALGWRITPNVQVRLGYEALMLNQVARVADQVNTVVNPNRFPGANPPQGGVPEPAFYFNRTNTWLHGGTVGIEFTY